MTFAPYMHVGLVVPDLEEAIANFGETLGIRFTEPTASHLDRFVERGVTGTLDVRYVYSLAGPPYYELIEATDDDGLYSRSRGLGVHHTGIWVDDCPAAVARFEEQGLQVEAVCYVPGDEGAETMAVVYFEPAGLENMRLEIVDESTRPGLESWIADAAAGRTAGGHVASPNDYPEVAR